MKRHSITILSLLFSFFLVSQSVAQNTVSIFFDYDKHNIRTSELEKLNNLFSTLQKEESVIVTVEGHTDNHGSNAYNDALSNNRVKSVIAHLKSQGLENVSFAEGYFGEEQPATENSNAANRQLNRRVEVTWLSPSSTASDFSRLQSQFRQEKQKFEIDPSSYCTVTGEKGTKIFLPPNVLVDKSGKPVEGMVSVELREFYTMADLITNGMTTMSKGRILETGGSIDLRLFNEEGEELELGPDQEIGLEFNTPRQGAPMQSFISLPNARGADWVPEFLRVPMETRFSTYGDKHGILYCNFKVTDQQEELPKVGDMINSLLDDYDKEDNFSKLTAFQFQVNGENLQYIDLGDDRIRNKLVAKVRAKIAAKVKTTTTSNNFIQSRSLGFINCDRFKSVEYPITVKLSIPETDACKSYLVFNDIKSLMNPNGPKRNSEVIFRGIPKQGTATLINFVASANGQILFGKKKIDLNEGSQEHSLEYKVIDPVEFVLELSALG